MSAHSTDIEQVSYLGFPIIVRERTLAILDPATGRKLYDGAMVFASARRFIKAYKKAGR